jgi:hypothetical protein
MKRWGWGAAVAAAVLLTAAVAQDRSTKVLNDRDRVEASGFWIYNDFPRALGEAKKTGKPLLAVFRCVPCANCVQLDDTVVARDASIQGLLSQFVCVRMITTNGMDLSLFQFDYDQSWTSLVMNGDRVVYGRYGTRSHQTESQHDMSLAGFRRALEGSLALHRQYPKNKTALAGKQGTPMDYPSPEQYPSFKGKYAAKLEFGPKVAQSCIHCHMVGEAQRLVFRNGMKPIPESVLFPYPHPRILGLVVDPASRATLRDVTPASSAARDGFKPGDELVSLEGQPILSIADIQWVLHHAGSAGKLKAEVLRAGKTVPLALTLDAGWRRRDNLSWRATSWDLRRMATGGLLLESLTPDQRKQAGAPAEGLALRVKHVGEYGAHAVAKQAGVRKEDVVVGVDGKTQPMTESELLAYLVSEKKPGDLVPFTVLRSGAKLEMTIRMQ